MARAIYTYYIDRGVLVIFDTGTAAGAMSVTNDMEGVLDEIKRNIGELPPLIVYRDSEGQFDGVVYSGGNASFYHIGSELAEDAVTKALERSGRDAA